MSHDASPKRIAEIFQLDAKGGVVRWRTDRGHRREGDVAGGKTVDGYYRVGLDGRDYLLHRVIWCLAYGAWPAGVIDHINGDRSDNRLCNLRDVDQTINLLNAKVGRKSRLGLRGVDVLPSGKFRARIKAKGRRCKTTIGVFTTAEEASLAYERTLADLIGRLS